jgi:crotonobetainyl-CoA:carnitine CoA-transferase CaiB-like acyl-CoA transferase
MGLQRAQGGKANPPVFPAQLAPTDYTTGAMGALGTILAIYARIRTGVVQRVDSNLLNGGAVLSSEWFTRYEGKPERPLADKGQYGLNPFYRLYQVSDGWIYVVAESETAREAMCKAVDGEALLSAHSSASGASHPNDTPLAEALAERFATVRVDDILKRLKAAGVPCAPALPGDSEIFLNAPHASANEMIATYNHAWAGKLLVAWRYVQFGNTVPVEGKSTPLLGEQNRDVLREVGFSDEAIDELYAKGIIKTETAS